MSETWRDYIQEGMTLEELYGIYLALWDRHQADVLGMDLMFPEFAHLISPPAGLHELREGD